MVDISTVNGIINQLITWGAPPCGIDISYMAYSMSRLKHQIHTHLWLLTSNHWRERASWLAIIIATKYSKFPCCPPSNLAMDKSIHCYSRNPKLPQHHESSIQFWCFSWLQAEITQIGRTQTTWSLEWHLGPTVTTPAWENNSNRLHTNWGL